MEHVVCVLTLGNGWGYLKFENNQWRTISNKYKADVFKTKEIAIAIKHEILRHKIFDDAFIEAI